MIVMQGSSAHELYRDTLRYVLEEGETVDVRGYRTKEVLDFATVITQPWHHCHFVPGRRWNPWIAMSEALWILAGRNDIAPLLPYNKRITEFSDNYGMGTAPATLWGAYGMRIKDQIALLIRRLEEDPSDRRAILQIWRVNDLNAKTKDPPCLAGETIVLSPQGNIPIRELVGKRYPVYTLNEDTKEVELKWATGKKSGIKQLIRLLLDDGTQIKLTPDHRVMTKRRERIGNEKKQGSTTIYEWKRADELCAGDSLVPIRVIGNHKIVDIDALALTEDVYDLEVEDNHNFFVGTGVLVHNCNDMVMFKLRDDKLHMTVINRSNDLHWGLYAVNIPTFGILQDWLAARLGVSMGTQAHLSNSLHVYRPQLGMKANWDITRNMTAEGFEPLPMMPGHERAFTEPVQLDALVEACNAALSADADDYEGPIPFLMFANDFLRGYRLGQFDLDNDCRYAEKFQDWIMAAQVWEGAP